MRALGPPELASATAASKFAILVHQVFQAREVCTAEQMHSLVRALLDAIVDSGVPLHDVRGALMAQKRLLGLQAFVDLVIDALRTFGRPGEEDEQPRDARAERDERGMTLLTTLAGRTLASPGSGAPLLLRRIVLEGEHFCARQMGLMAAAACDADCPKRTGPTCLQSIMACIGCSPASDLQVWHMIVRLGDMLGGPAMPAAAFKALLDAAHQHAPAGSEERFARVWSALAHAVEAHRAVGPHANTLVASLLDANIDLDISHRRDAFRVVCGVFGGAQMRADAFGVLLKQVCAFASIEEDYAAILSLTDDLVDEVGGCDMPGDLLVHFLRTVSRSELSRPALSTMFRGFATAYRCSLPPLTMAAPGKLPQADERVQALANEALAVFAQASSESLSAMVEGLAGGLCFGMQRTPHCEALLRANEAVLGQMRPLNVQEVSEGLAWALGGPEMFDTALKCLIEYIASPRPLASLAGVGAMMQGLVQGLGGTDIASEVLANVFTALRPRWEKCDGWQCRTLVTAIVLALGGSKIQTGRLEEILDQLRDLQTRCPAPSCEQMLFALGEALGGTHIADVHLEQLLGAMAQFYARCADPRIAGLARLLELIIRQRPIPHLLDKLTRQTLTAHATLSGAEMTRVLQQLQVDEHHLAKAVIAVVPELAANLEPAELSRLVKAWSKAFRTCLEPRAAEQVMLTLAACMKPIQAARDVARGPASAGEALERPQTRALPMSRPGHDGPAAPCTQKRTRAAAASWAPRSNEVVTGWDEKGAPIIGGQPAKEKDDSDVSSAPSWGWGWGAERVHSDADAILRRLPDERLRCTYLAREIEAIQVALKEGRAAEVAALVCAVVDHRPALDSSRRRLDALRLNIGELVLTLKAGALRGEPDAKEWQGKLQSRLNWIRTLLKDQPACRDMPARKGPDPRRDVRGAAKESKSELPPIEARSHAEMYKWTARQPGAVPRKPNALFYPDPDSPCHFHLGKDFITLRKKDGGHYELYKEGQPMPSVIQRARLDLQKQAAGNAPMAMLLRVVEVMCGDHGDAAPA